MPRFRIFHDGTREDGLFDFVQVEANSWYDAKEYAKRFQNPITTVAFEATADDDSEYAKIGAAAMSSHERHLDEHESTYNRGWNDCLYGKDYQP